MPTSAPKHRAGLPRAKKHQPLCKQRVLPLNQAAWRELRAQVLAEEPLCRRCEAVGRLTPSREVDHENGDGNDNRRQNLQGLCKSCHSTKTAMEDGGFGRAYGKL